MFQLPIQQNMIGQYNPDIDSEFTKYMSCWKNISHEFINQDKAFVIYQNLFKVKSVLVKIDNFISLRKTAKECYVKNFYIKFNVDSISFNIYGTFGILNLIIKNDLNIRGVKSLAKEIHDKVKEGMGNCFLFDEDSTILQELNYISESETLQVSLNLLMTELGYANSNLGVCYGASFMVIQAFCRDDVKTLLKRIKTINKLFDAVILPPGHSDKIEIVNHIAKKMSSCSYQTIKEADLDTQLGLNEEVKQANFPAFFDGIRLSQGYIRGGFPDSESENNLHNFYGQNYGLVSSFFSNNQDKKIEITRHAIVVDFFGKNIFSKLIKSIMDSPSNIVFALHSDHHTIALGGNEKLGCLLFDNLSAYRIYSPHQSLKILSSLRNTTGLISIELFAKPSRGQVLEFLSYESKLRKDSLVKSEKCDRSLLDISMTMNHVTRVSDCFGLILHDFDTFNKRIHDINVSFRCAICHSNYEVIEITLNRLLTSPHQDCTEKIFNRMYNNDLINFKMDDNNKKYLCYPLLNYVMQRGNNETVELFYKTILNSDSINISQKINLIFPTNNIDNNPLNFAVNKHLTDKVEIIVKNICNCSSLESQHKVDLLIGDPELPCLYLASKNGYAGIVKIFIENIIHCEDISVNDKIYLLLSKSRNDLLSALNISKRSSQKTIIDIFLTEIYSTNAFTNQQKCEFLLKSTGGSFFDITIMISQSFVSQEYKDGLSEILRYTKKRKSPPD